LIVDADPCLVSELIGERRGSVADFSLGARRVDTSLFVAGDFARFADSRNQCFNEASWFMIGCG
jgi:hypothetical protein